MTFSRPAVSTLVLLSVSVLAGLPASAPRLAAQEPSLDELFQGGVDALKDGRLEQAEEAFQTILSQPEGKDAIVHHNLGIVYQQKGDHKQALAQLREAKRLQPDTAASRTLLGVSFLALGETKEAIAELEKAVELKPDDHRSRLQLVRAYETAGDAPAVVDQLRALKELAPRDPEYAYRLGKAYVALAAWSTQQMIDTKPDSARVYQALGENYFVQGKLATAVRALTRAAEIDPALPGVHWTLAQVYLEQGEKQKALDAVERELAAVPASVMASALKQKLVAELGAALKRQQ